jgi:phage shock protein C
MKKLFRSNNDILISGVLAGVGECYGVDPTIIRLAYVCLTCFTAVIPGIIVYIIAVIIVPKKIDGQIIEVTPLSK